MSLSYIEPDLITARPERTNRAAKLAAHCQQFKTDLKRGVAEVTTSPQFASVLIRVVSALAIAFMLVRLAKIYTA